MKQNITQREFAEKLKDSEEFYNETFNFGNNDISFPREILYSIKFEDCSFTANTLILKDINQPELGLLFSNCTFKCKILIQNTTINTLWFEEIKEIESLEFNSFSKESSYINLFRFHYSIKNINNPLLETNFSFQNYIFKRDFHFINVNMERGKFDIIQCEIGDKKDINSKIFFENSKIQNLFIYKCSFNVETSFKESKFSYDPETIKRQKFSSIEKSIFEKTTFTSCEFNDIFGINNCNFNDSLDFNKVKGIDFGILRIFWSKFNNYVSFDNANLKSITIYECQFTNILSIQKAKFFTVDITNTTFEKTTFFDEITILNIFDCKRHTIRTIKQQLQKAENKIDYNRFRAYELSAYYQELNWKWKGDFKDKFILWSTKYVTGFDHSWRKALRFTLISSLIFYSLFFVTENYMYSVDFSYYREFLSGAFRFLLVTDFYNPLSDGRHYIDATNTTGWFIFILGKIVIAFGIYEMIQAFRKFKA